MSFDGFVSARLPALLRYAVVLTGDTHLAQDVVQEVLARTQLRWERVERAGSVEAYVRRMIVNEYLSWRRSWAFRNVQAAGDRLADLAGQAAGRGPSGASSPMTDDPALHAVRAEDADAVWALLATLPRRQRAVLVLRYYEGLDDRAIADVLGCTPVTVRAHASKALKALRLDVARPSLIPH